MYSPVFAPAYNVKNAQYQCRQIGAHDSCSCKDVFVSALIVARLTTFRLYLSALQVFTALAGLFASLSGQFYDCMFGFGFDFGYGPLSFNF